MKVKSLLVTLLLAFVVASSVVVAQRTTIQLGMVLPANSVWDKSLKQMGANWSTVTDGRVRLRVLAGANDESTLLRRLKLGRPQAAALGQPGLTQIDDAFSVLGIPFFFESYEEAFYVLEKLTPALTEVLAMPGGHIFSRPTKQTVLMHSNNTRFSRLLAMIEWCNGTSSMASTLNRLRFLMF